MKKIKLKLLKKGYQDGDTLMFYACFEILQKFVEKYDLFNYSVDFKETTEGKILVELYEWWLTRSSKYYIESLEQQAIDKEKLKLLIANNHVIWL